MTPNTHVTSRAGVSLHDAVGARQAASREGDDISKLSNINWSESYRKKSKNNSGWNIHRYTSRGSKRVASYLL